MKKNNSNKVSAFFALFLFLISFVLLLKHVFSSTEHQFHIASHVFAIGLLLVSFIILFIISFKSVASVSSNNISAEENKNTGLLEKQNSSEKQTVGSVSIPKVENYLDIIDIIRGEFNLRIFSEKLFSELAKKVEIVQGVGFVKNPENLKFEPIATFAYSREGELEGFDEGEGIIGQVAKTRQVINITDIHEESLKVISGLGEATPSQIVVFPVVNNDDCICIFELGFFNEIAQDEIQHISELLTKLGFHFNRRIEDLYKA